MPSPKFNTWFHVCSIWVLDVARMRKFDQGDKVGVYGALTLYRGPAKIAEVVNDDDLSILSDFEPPLWAANPHQQNQREDHFLKSLDIEDWGWSELASSVSELEDDARKNVEDWMSQKEDVWLMRFYALLGEASDTHNEFIDVSKLRIVRVDGTEGDEHVIPKNAYFPQDGGISLPKISFVKATVYQTGGTEPQKRLSESFLKQIGVIPFNEKAVIELSLAQYNQLPEQVMPTYFTNINSYIAYWKKNPSDSGLFRGSPFLRGYSADRILKWCKPTLLCLDAPYIDSGLAELTSIHKKCDLSTEYRDKLTGAECKDFIDFLKAIGVMTCLVIEKSDIKSHPNSSQISRDFSWAKDTNTGIDIDYTIDNLQSYLKERSVPASKLIWQAITNATSVVSKARYTPNQQHKLREYDSQLVCHLKSVKWIPDKSGVFYHPQDIDMNELPDDFPFNDKNGLLTAIGFGACAKEREKDYLARNEFAIAAGYSSAKEMDEWKKVRDLGITPAEILEQLKQRQQVSQPEDSVLNPDRRRAKVSANAANAPSKESVILQRSVQKSIAEVTEQAKAYLRTKCKNVNDQLVCQCCHNEMPFKLRSGEYYFEAVQCIGDQEKRHFENRIALCPNCAAMYQYACETSDAEILSCIVDHEVCKQASFVEIPVQLAGNEFALRFVSSHWFDLKTILSQQP